MPETRKEIDCSLIRNTNSTLGLMAEGNPGAISVLASLLKEENGIFLVLGLDDMNIRGTQIWIGYKDYCRSDIERFIECVLHRDKGMVETINKEKLAGNHKAVTSGACYNRELLKKDFKKQEPKPMKRLIRLSS
jgi:hypothetical protein